MINKYTDEINIQILISLLKAHNVKKIIISPGTSNISIIGSIQNDDYFEKYSCVDERSAAYMACGLAAESLEPVALVCTGATASRNYIPGLTEAFYRKLPVIAITACQHFGKIGQNVAQILDRSVQLNDMVKLSVQIPSVHTEEDKWACNLKINDALLECKRNGGGPVHINIVSTYSDNFNIEKLPDTRVIKRIEYSDKLPDLNNKKIVIFVGSHQKFSKELTESVDLFCEKYNAVVVCDRTSNYFGKYKILGNIMCDQIQYNSKLKKADIMIDIGNVSGAYMGLNSKETWRVNPDGIIRDTYKKLTHIFQMTELDFFNKYNNLANNDICTEFYKQWKDEVKRLREAIDDDKLPFSNIWIAKNTIDLLPDESVLHLGILNSLRSWNFFDSNNKIYGYSNTGGFGIDGCVSSLIGASLANPDKNIYGVVGDLAFFYDMNSLGNREIGKNVRLMVINNGCGTEFHNYNHRGSIDFGDDVGQFIAADGHFGNKSKTLLKNYSESLGFKYLSANNKEEYLKNVEDFVLGKSDKPVIFEIFTTSSDESEAVKMMHNLIVEKTAQIKKITKKMLGEKNVAKIKNVLKK